LLRRKKPAAKEPPSKRAKPSPAAIPQTPDAPFPSPTRNDIDMEDAGGQFGSMPEANPVAPEQHGRFSKVIRYGALRETTLNFP
jgi:hypothetical protein